MDVRRIRVSGIVQGVGFRPFVFGLAERFALAGWVCNTSSALEIHIEGDTVRVAEFLAELPRSAPPLSRIDSIRVEPAAPQAFARFEIRTSPPPEPGAFQPVSPDIALCGDCLRELLDPHDRRYLYPFTNCTRCGPRLTIIRDLPYDRARTSMAPFDMCPDCRREYEDPRDRRFHAEPTACPVCGPRVRLIQPPFDEPSAFASPALDPLTTLLRARRMLREGRILAVRGLGGFHLACDASNAHAVEELRRRKRRSAKPFAVMARDLAILEAICAAGAEERALLDSREKPIVILRRRGIPSSNPAVADVVAPGNGTLGMMLPYTPLHELLLHAGDPNLDSEPAPAALVMTSGNRSEEPLAIGNAEALGRLGALADAFLLHDREIIQRCDDSVARVFAPGTPQLLRRSRGYAPAALTLPRPARPLLAVGGELKNAFCLARERYAFLSPHVGDMENAETLEAFDQAVMRFRQLFHTDPEAIAHDLHPAYLGTRWAVEHANGIPLVGVQHHHAHAAACMAENGFESGRRAIALAFDGTGYGLDGAVWGGEVLLADYLNMERMFHLEYLPLPGGDAAIRKPWRAAVGFAEALGIPIDGLPFVRARNPLEVETIRAQTRRRLNAPPVSSMGRLFDAVAALCGLPSCGYEGLPSCGYDDLPSGAQNKPGEIDYEAQGAIELEELALRAPEETGAYPFAISGGVIRLGDLLTAVAEDVRRSVDVARIGMRFHRTVCRIALGACEQAREESGLGDVVLSGGVWQNHLLMTLALPALQAGRFAVYTHKLVPTNDGGLAFGQAVVAAERMA